MPDNKKETKPIEETANKGAKADTAPVEKPTEETEILTDALAEETYNAGYQTAMKDFEQEAATPNPTSGRKMARASLLAVVVKMPANLRVGGFDSRLNELEEYLDGYDGEDRYIAAELIKAICEARPNDIASNQFKYDVDNAMRLLNDIEESHTSSADLEVEQNAAADRLKNVTKSNKEPQGFKDKKQDGTKEQKEAFNRLHGEK